MVEGNDISDDVLRTWDMDREEFFFCIHDFHLEGGLIAKMNLKQRYLLLFDISNRNSIALQVFCIPWLFPSSATAVARQTTPPQQFPLPPEVQKHPLVKRKKEWKLCLAWRQVTCEQEQPEVS